MLVTPAFAQGATAAAPSMLNSMLIPMLLVFGIMYFFLIRPQQKKLKEDQKMREALRKGDQVVTTGGLIGKIAKVKDDGEVELEIAANVKVRVTRAAVVQVISKTEPAQG